MCATRGIDIKKKKKTPLEWEVYWQRQWSQVVKLKFVFMKKASKALFLSEALSFPRGTELQTVRDAKNTTVAEHTVSTSEHRVERSGRILSHSGVSPLNSKDTLQPVLDNPSWDPVPGESPTVTCPVL